MHSRAKGPTKAERARMEAIACLGCIACRLECRPKARFAEIHHLLDGGVRRGHSFTIGLCGWHHVGRPAPQGLDWSERNLGPSFALNKRAFHAKYGKDDFLLELQNRLLAEES